MGSQARPRPRSSTHMRDFDLQSVLIGADAVVPRARYTSAQFAEWELERLWARVWQVACREEEVSGGRGLL